MSKPGRQRWKCIRAMAREGPPACFRRWGEAKKRLDAMVAFDAPEVILAWNRAMVHDRAVAVRLAKPGAGWEVAVRSERMLGARCLMAEHGHEETPESFADLLKGAVGRLRRALDDTGWPLPQDDGAFVQLIEWMKSAKPPAAARKE